jgi:hypothetical protein
VFARRYTPDNKNDKTTEALLHYGPEFRIGLPKKSWLEIIFEPAELT